MTGSICGTATGGQETKMFGGNEGHHTSNIFTVGSSHGSLKKADGSIRLCADFPTGLNAVLEDHQYPLPIPEDIFTILYGGTCFAEVDLTETYLQVEVSAAFREMLTNTPWFI